MANVSFDNTDFSTLGVSVTSISGRGLAAWKGEGVDLRRRGGEKADTSFQFDPGQTSVSGMISADTDNFTFYTHAEMMNRLDALKELLNPVKGFRKLTVTGDQPSRWRWARFQSMDYQNQHKPIFKVPFEPISINFENYEAYWRELVPPVRVSVIPTTIPNEGADTRPLVEFTIASTIVAATTAIVQPVTLATIDDLSINWKGTAADTDGTLHAGDVLVVDAETMTVLLRPGGAGSAHDVVRHYDFSGPGAYRGNGFPLIKRGGSIVSSLNTNVQFLTVSYDQLRL